jgi:hypothetical protein
MSTLVVGKAVGHSVMLAISVSRAICLSILSCQAQPQLVDCDGTHILSPCPTIRPRMQPAGAEGCMLAWMQAEPAGCTAPRKP